MEITGPSEENLNRLATFLTGMANESIQAQSAPKKPMGSKVCVACCAIFGRRNKDGTLKPEVCKSCRKTLSAGGTIFVCDDHRMVKLIPKADGSTKINPAYAGRIIKVPGAWMDELVKAGHGLN